MKERLFNLVNQSADLWWHIEDIRRVLEIQIRYICERNMNPENESIISVLRTQLQLVRLVEQESQGLQEQIEHMWMDCKKRGSQP